MNYNRMTVRESGTEFSVFKMKSQQSGGYSTDGAAKRFSYFVSAAAKPQFTGTYAECVEHITSAGAEYMSEHGIGV